MWDSRVLSTLIWAIFLLIVILVLIFTFKEQFKVFLASISKGAKISFKGNSIELGGELVSSYLEQQTNPNVRYFEFNKAFQNSVVTNEEKIIRQQLINARLTQNQAVETLIYQLANKNFIIYMLHIDKIIYEEQISLLNFLNTKFTPCSERELSVFYEDWQKKSKDQNYKFESFLGFLTQFGLVTKNIAGYTITQLGKEYLCFLIKIGRL